MFQRRNLLRTATLELHEALDARVGALDSRANYCRYLSAMAEFRSIAEVVVVGNRPAGCAFAPLLLSDVFAEDCVDLGIGIRKTLSAPVPRADGDAWFGVVYVLEGSALGAKLLIKRAATLGYHAGYGARHLARQVTAGTNWSCFIETLERRQPFDLDAATHAACATFALALAATEDT